VSRLAERFAALRARGEKALVVFVTAGDPDLGVTEALLPALAEAGADAIELGVPWSDPTADGPKIQRASERALRAGTTLRRVLSLVKTVRARIDVPLVLMGYANPFLAMGERNFPEAARDAGVDGVITVDCPPEEEPGYFEALEACGVDAVLLAAPTTTEERLAQLARRTRGFLYYVSLTGVTGARTGLPPRLVENLARIRRVSDVPVCVGFGISTPEQAAYVAQHADGVAVGSALVDRIERAASREEAVTEAASFVASLKAALRPGGGAARPAGAGRGA
jgi:tryptophan synthase alpha chain